MIPKENLYKESLLKFKGTYCRWADVYSYISMSMPLSFEKDLDLKMAFKAISEENLIFPLDHLQSSTLPQDQKGCRIYDWKVLSTPQIKNMMKLSGHYQTVQVAVPMTHFIAQEIDEQTLQIPNMPTYEKYDKFLNVTYLVNDEFLQDWCNPHYENENVAKKEVKDCSISELLFAIKKKIDKQKVT